MEPIDLMQRIRKQVDDESGIHFLSNGIPIVDRRYLGEFDEFRELAAQIDDIRISIIESLRENGD
jgi:hypothetical protein